MHFLVLAPLLSLSLATVAVTIGIETTGPDGIHYGWLHIENDNPQWLTGGRVTGYAYETTHGVPILVGAIPEMSALWLFLAGIGVGLQRRR